MEKNEDNYFELELSEKRQLTSDTYFFKFKFLDPSWYMGLPVAKFMKFCKPPETEGGKVVARKYTPVSPMTQQGSVDFVIKCYTQCEEFP